MRHTLAAAAAVTVVVTALAVPTRSDAQPTAPELGSLRYALVDLGTLGGPNSAETQEFPFINNAGLVVGFADTAIPQESPEGFVFHAFQWRRGPITDLGTLPGGVNSFAVWSNNHGAVVGLSEDGSIDPLLGGPAGLATLWTPGGDVVDLGTLGGNESLATYVNDRTQIAGVASNAVPDPFSLFGWGVQTRAFVWEKGRMRDLGTLGGPDAAAFLINEQGELAGSSYTNATPNPDTGIPTLDPFIWRDGKMVDLGTLGGTVGFANALNNQGQIAGQSDLPGDQSAHPYLWDNGVLHDLGTLGGSSGLATWLNDAGDVTGGAQTSDGASHAFFWRNGVMRDLGTINDDTCSVSHFMNASAQVVGTSGDCGGQFEKHGFLSEQGGPMIDLNAFVPPGLNLTMTDGESINDHGEIAGTGMLPNGDLHAVVLLPCDDKHPQLEGCRDARSNVNATSSAPASDTVPSASVARRMWRPSDMADVLAHHRMPYSASGLTKTMRRASTP
jgi:probable HAF family extracellular repeat protein